MTAHWQRRHTRMVSVATPILSGDQPLSAAHLECLHRLLGVGQALQGQRRGVVKRLCQEVLAITQGKLRLTPRHVNPNKQQKRERETISISYSVRCGDRLYGTLHVAPDLAHPDIPTFPLAIARLFADLCGVILHDIEQSAFIQVLSQPQQLPLPEGISLSPRLREVLALIVEGYDMDEIAQKLCISPKTVAKHRQQIYDEFGIHGWHQVRMAAYPLGLYSPLDDPTTE